MRHLPKRNERGAALLTVLVALMIISIMLFEFQYSAMVERKLAYNELNQLQALYLARSGARIGLLRIAIFGRVQASPAVKSMAGGMNLGPYLDLIWNMPLPAFPPAKEAISKLFKDDRDAAEKQLKETKVTDGQFTEVITTESSKINLNYLMVPTNLANTRVDFRNTPTTLFAYVGTLLLNVLENLVKNSEDAYQEYGNLRPEDVIYDIMDWINPGTQSMAGGNKDAFYETQNPPYKTKRNRFYTLDELKLVKGIDDHLFQKLKPFITVNSYDGKININSASNDMLRALYKNFTDDDIKRLGEEHDRLGAWASESQFVSFINDTLGRTEFKTIYNDPNNYPFTVMSQSFLVESMGSVNKSKTSIQKLIRVAVALKSPSGGEVDAAVTTQAACQAKGEYWDLRSNVCRTIPTTNDECISSMAGSMILVGAVYCCSVPGQQPACPTAVSAAAGAGGATATTPGTTPPAAGTTPTTVIPSAMRILSWTES
jgi:type II secretory pathway component PulK